METQLAVIVLLVAGFGLVAARLARLSIGPALAFVVVGMLLSDDLVGSISLEPQAEPVRILAEATLALVLFSDASTIRARALRRDASPVGRLLLIGLPLTIALGAALALMLFPGTPLGVALLIGAALAPTDAALGQPVVTNPAVPARIRRLLNVESGLNDGIATPFVLLALALSASEGTGDSGWLVEASSEIVLGAAAGMVLGFAGGALLRRADRSAWTSPVSRQLFVLALAASSYLVAIAIGGNGFIAAFTGGLAFGRGSEQHEEDAVGFTEAQGSLLAIGVWIAFGLTIAGRLMTDLWDPAAIAYAVLSLTVIRMVPVAIALAGSRFQPATVLFMGWFGPRGLASLVFLIIGLEGLYEVGAATGPLAATVTWTVLLSVVLHGLSAGPLASRYGSRMSGLTSGSPELEDTVETRPHRGVWAGSSEGRPT